MKYRKYNPQKDKQAALRIFREVAWLEKGKNKLKEEIFNSFIKAGRSLVAEVRETPECLALTMPGTIRYIKEDLPLCAVTGVLTSRIARKMGLASQLTAQIIADEAEEGALVAGLGMFEQGFYNKLGFGTGPYEHWISFDPAILKLESKNRVPYRISPDDWKAVHASRLSRIRLHGSCNLLPPEASRLEMNESQNGFGLGYFDGKEGELTHHLWISGKGESGPYRVWWMTYQNYKQFLELMSILKSLGDQIHSVRMREPPGIQIQDILTQPFKYRTMTKHTDFENNMKSAAYWQVRILNLKGCIIKTHLLGRGIKFNLKLRDPIDKYLEKETKWRGISGQYIVSLGEVSDIENGINNILPTLTSEVGAFTRLWLGVRSATSLSVTDELSGPKELLEELDYILRLPEPKIDWDF